MLKIVIVDDEITALSLFCDCIKNFNSQFCVIGCFTSGEDALEFLTKHDCDVLITDIKMPGMSGLELAKEVSVRFPIIKTIIVSAYQEFEYAKKAIEYGVYLYLEKPVNLKELYDALLRIKTSLDERTFFDDNEIIPDEIFTDFMFGALPSFDVFKADLISIGFSEALFSRKVLLIDINLKQKELAAIWNHGKARIHYYLKSLICDSSKSENVYFAYRGNERFIFIVHAPFQDNTPAVLENNIRIFFSNLVDTISLKRYSSISEIENYLNYNAARSENQNSVFFDSENESVLNPEDIIAKAKKYIEENYKKDIMRDDVAEQVYVSPSYFSRIFKQATGCSFSDYLTQIRIKNAILLLEKGEKPTRIYNKIGYNSNKYFVKNFLKQTLYTPAEYQEKILKTGDGYED